MSVWRIWGRLLWKELREGWLAVLVALVIPLVLFPASAHCSRHSIQRTYLTLIVEIGPLLAIALYAARKAEAKERRAEPASSLPGRPILTWITSFLIPMTVVALVGAVYGGMSLIPGSADTPLWLVPTKFLSQLLFGACLTWALLFAGCFGICYLLSAATSLWISLAAGVGWVIYGAVAVETTQPNMSQPVHWIYESIREYDDFAECNLAIAFAAVIGCLLFVLLAKRASFRMRRVISIGTTLALMLVFLGPKALAPLWSPRDETWWSYPGSFSSPDGSFHVTSTENPYAKTDKVKISFTDKRTGRVVTGAFKPPIRILCARNHQYVYLARLLKDRRSFEILVWDTVLNKATSAATIPRSTGSLADSFALPSSVSPDGRYLLTCFKSSLGLGWDLWLVDLRNKRGRMVFPNDHFNMEVAWRDGQAIMRHDGKCLAVDMKSMRANYRSLDGGGSR